MNAAAIAIAAVLSATAAAAAAPAPTIWEEATESPDAAAARTAYDAQMLAGDDLIAIAVASDRLDERGRLVQAALSAYEAAAIARPDLAEPHWRAALVLHTFYNECAMDRAPLCVGGPRKREAERLIAHWDAAERLAPWDPRVAERVLPDRAILHTKLASPAHLEAARVDYQRILDRRRGVTPVEPLGSNTFRRAFALGNMAETMMMLGDLDAAIEAYREADRLSPDLSRAFGLAVALDRDGQASAAAEVLHRQGADAAKHFVQQLADGDIFFVPRGEASYYLGLVAALAGDDVVALEHFEAYIDSGAHPRFQPRAREHVAALRTRIARQVHGAR